MINCEPVSWLIDESLEGSHYYHRLVAYLQFAPFEPPTYSKYLVFQIKFRTPFEIGTIRSILYSNINTCPVQNNYINVHSSVVGAGLS